MNTFEFYSRVKALKVEVNHVSTEFQGFILNANQVLQEGFDRIAESNLTHLFAGASAGDIPEKVLDDLSNFFDVDKITAVSKYSPYNTLVWVKRLQRKLNNWNKITLKYQKRLWAILNDIESLETYQAMGNKWRTETNEIKQEIKTALNYRISYQEKLKTYLCMSMGYWIMKKNDFLSLLSIDHSKGRAAEMRIILDGLPDKIDFERFMIEVFANNIEAQEDCMFFDIFFKDFIDRVKKGEIDTSMIFHEVLKEPIPMYKAETDEYGRMVSMEQDRPNLKLL
ncbi:hypothetical protein [Bacillus atrophaeus]|uniref:hypothetical protein n=1 Tax=Bacillus atrophaeus TaxID=1452 RepID=UPI0022822ED9|nr:hypothetical protein [Bacillus atrophaeus]MCY8842440.1 hypothetical protein [Bacillus atrophaeus]MEC0804650.1 hypothetical protein [Bacillus atrophaeus]MEC0852567.1 hypothetical protein [Bacillus atrophaeus]MEC0859479.1 hypothetical protein [Bacillus atrophaeus]MEC0862286.1 hypothetical protein [Bacillus atrophaeus]